MEKILKTEDTIFYRLTCDCLDPGHALDIQVERWGKADENISISFHERFRFYSWRQRIKAAWHILLGQEVEADDFGLREEDREALATLLRGENREPQFSARWDFTSPSQSGEVRIDRIGPKSPDLGGGKARS